MNRKQQAFVTEYLKDHNASQAAIRAGYSKRNPNVVGPRLLATVGIAEAIAKAAEDSRSEAIMTLAEAQEIASQIGRDPEAPRRDRLGALDRLSKFNGWDKPQQIDGTIRVVWDDPAGGSAS